MKVQQINNRILIADDERSSRLLLCQFLGKKGYETYEAKDGQDAINIIEEFSPNIAILDYAMPRFSGIEVVKELRQHGHYPLLYTILLTGYTDRSDQEKAIKSGIDAFLPKPLDLSAMMSLIQLAMNELEQKRDVCLDHLTNVYTATWLPQLLGGMDRQIGLDEQEPGAVLIFELDHLKSIHVTYGDQVGDQVITKFAELIGEVTRKKDIPCRVSEDRFLILLPEASKDATVMIGQRVLEAVSKWSFPEGVKLSVSIGGATYTTGSQFMLESATQALMQAKMEGRGSMHFYQ